ncbi:MAG: AAA family ATPase [Deltaproteobacteria bacterium]|nr:AAA family ATPase [Deltaproteobacteria bacterium]MBW2072201.1 AAA family ATPase [Deltaproteobacteria bacterium]
MAAHTSRDTVCSLYEFIQAHLYFNRQDIQVNGLRANSTLLFTLFTALLGGKALIIGEPGLGKTTAAEYVGSLFYRLPVGTLWASEVSGHPEQTEEKIVGRPDLGKLNQGQEVVVWSNFVQLPIKIVDEINRLPETKQSMILDGVDRGNWEYLNEMIINEEYCLFATANYQDQGTNTIIAPMLDRFDVTVESRYPGPSYAYLISQKQEKEEILRHPELEVKLQQVLRSQLDQEEKRQKMAALAGEFAAHLKDVYDLPTLDEAARQQLRTQIQQMPLDQDANAYMRMLLAELSFCERHGQKRSSEICEEGCHYTGYLCHRLRNCASNRLPVSLSNYARALAWFQGLASASLEQVRTVAPYCIAHRLQWTEAHIASRQKDRRQDPLHIHLARQACLEVYQRYTEQADHVKEALARAYQVFQGNKVEPLSGDHPIYAEIRKDLYWED